MKKFTFKNPLAVNENDTLGDAIIKGLTEGYIKGTLAAGAGLGVTALVIKAFSKKGNSKKKEEEITRDSYADVIIEEYIDILDDEEHEAVH
jgi:hypothetical protein